MSHLHVFLIYVKFVGISQHESTHSHILYYSLLMQNSQILSNHQKKKKNFKCKSHGSESSALALDMGSGVIFDPTAIKQAINLRTYSP